MDLVLRQELTLPPRLTGGQGSSVLSAGLTLRLRPYPLRAPDAAWAAQVDRLLRGREVGRLRPHIAPGLREVHLVDRRGRLQVLLEIDGRQRPEEKATIAAALLYGRLRGQVALALPGATDAG